MRWDSSPVAGSSTMRRISLPTAVSPGSKVSRAWYPRSARALASARAWVDLPDPSPPSKQTKTPVVLCNERRLSPSAVMGLSRWPSVVETTHTSRYGGRMTDATTASPTLVTSDRVVLGGSALLTLLAGVADYGHWNSVVAFVLSAAAVCLLASVVGRSVEQLGDRFGPGATGVLQSALGNLPELFICIFALKAGLVDVVRAALVGSILANLLLVLGIAFIVGGLKHGTQQLGSERARTTVVLMLLSVSAMAVPSFTGWLHTPAASHEKTFSVLASVLLLVLFALTLPFSLSRVSGDTAETSSHEPPRWPLPWRSVCWPRPASAPRSCPTGSCTPSSRRWTHSR